MDIQTTKDNWRKNRCSTRKTTDEKRRTYIFHEFFAGGGMARLGLGAGWKCLFANDNSSKKAASYLANFVANGEFVLNDISNVKVSSIHGQRVALAPRIGSS